MRENLNPVLRRIVDDTQAETQRSSESLKRLKLMIRDAPPVISFKRALASGAGLIAEIKERSPSQGRMLEANVKDAPVAYRNSRVVKAVSVLTNRTHFGAGMTLKRFREVKQRVGKPVLRKDFITEEYQVFQSRAFGADAILLMANVLTREELQRLSDTAFELGMDVLFETHSEAELEDLPPRVEVVGINCRNFTNSSFRFARLLRDLWLFQTTDKSVKTARFEYVGKLPPNAIKVAESGVHAGNCAAVFSKGFHAVLVGTSLLIDPRGITKALQEFEGALETVRQGDLATSGRDLWRAAVV